MQILKQLLGSSTVRQSAIATISVTLASGLGAIYYLILARTIGPHDYGLFSLAVAVLSIGMSISDLGIAQGLVKFVGAHRADRKYFPFVKLAFQIKVIMGMAATAVLAIGAAFISQTIFHQPELKNLLPIVGVSVFGQLLFFHSTSVFQGLQKFTLWGGLQVGTNLIRLILLLPLVYFARLSSISSFVVFTASYLLGFVISLFLMDLGWVKATVTPAVKKEFWDFNRWTAVFVILASITARLDTILTGRFLSLTDVGIYSLALTMVSFLPQLASAIGAVTTAKFAGIANNRDEKTYLRKSLFFVIGISISISVVMIPIAWGVIKITGSAYAPAMLPFLILLIGNVIFLATNPVRDSILYFHSKPKFFVYMSVAQGAAILVSGLALIPSFGVVGVALAVVVNNLVCALMSIGYYLRLKS